MFANLNNTNSAYETARQCLPYYYAVAATSPHVQAMAAERLQAGWTSAQLRQTLPRLSDYHLATTDHASHVVNRWTHNAPVDKAPNVMRRKAEEKAARTIERRLKKSEREQWGTEQGRERLYQTARLWEQVQAEHPEYGRAQTALAVAQILTERRNEQA
jgi:hypothetical protein